MRMLELMPSTFLAWVLGPERFINCVEFTLVKSMFGLNRPIFTFFASPAEAMIAALKGQLLICAIIANYFCSNKVLELLAPKIRRIY